MKRKSFSMLAGLICCVVSGLAGCGNSGDTQFVSKTATKVIFLTEGNVTKSAVFMGSGGDIFTIGNSGAVVYGNTGNDTVTIAVGVSGVTADQNVEQIIFPDALSGYTFKQTGNLINVYDASGTKLMANAPVQDDADGTLLGFSNGTRSVLMTNSGGMQLGGVDVSKTAPAPVNALNTPPVANAGTAQNVAAGSLVTLDGSGSRDAEGDPLTYKWSFTSRPSGSNAALAGSASAKPAFTPDKTGSYIVSLIVNDGRVDSVAATVTVTAGYNNIGNTAIFINNIKATVEKLFYMRGPNGSVYRVNNNKIPVAKITVVNGSSSELHVRSFYFHLMDGANQFDDQYFTNSSGQYDDEGQPFTANVSSDLLTGMSYSIYVTFDASKPLSSGPLYLIGDSAEYPVHVSFSSGEID